MMESFEIPSDLDSEDGEYESNDNVENNKTQIDENEFNNRVEQILQLSETSRNHDTSSSSSESDLDDDRSLRERIDQLDGIWENKTRKYDNKSFTEDCGPIIPDNIQSPPQIFLCLFSDSLIDTIIKQTNLYSQQSRNSFVETTKEEILKFIGINIIMGIKRSPSIRDYWSANPQLHDSYISLIMPLNRFFSLLSNLHLNDNTFAPKKDQPGYDKLYKIRPMLDQLSHNFLKYYKPFRNQSIDESMIKFKGRSTIKQYMPQKPIKRGYKVWVRADEKGFVCEFQIYTGKIDGKTENLLGERVVKDLSRVLIGKYYNLYFDNYFTNVNLIITLKLEGILACGTIRSNRKELPKKQKADKNMTRGESEFKTSFKDVRWIKWNDNKSVQLLSNFHDPSITTTVSRRQKDGSVLEISCPQMIQDYNHYMGCVDKADMFKSFYEINRKSKKSWHRIFWHFVDVTVVNSFIIYKLNNPDTKMLLKDFRLVIVNEFVGFSNPKKRDRKPDKKSIGKYKAHVPNEQRFSKEPHIPGAMSKRKRCVCCSTKSQPIQTTFYCTTCKVSLCVKKNNCFQNYHKQ